VRQVPARRSTLPRTLIAATAALMLAFIASGAFVTTESWGEAPAPQIANPHDSPALGGEEAFTGYAVPTAGATVGEPND